jgi:hypothetical protein
MRLTRSIGQHFSKLSDNTKLFSCDMFVLKQVSSLHIYTRFLTLSTTAYCTLCTTQPFSAMVYSYTFSIDIRTVLLNYHEKCYYESNYVGHHHVAIPSTLLNSIVVLQFRFHDLRCYIGKIVVQHHVFLWFTVHDSQQVKFVLQHQHQIFKFIQCTDTAVCISIFLRSQ